MGTFTSKSRWAPLLFIILNNRGFVAFSEAWATKSMDSDTKKPKFEKVLRALLQVPSL